MSSWVAQRQATLVSVFLAYLVKYIHKIAQLQSSIHCQKIQARKNIITNKGMSQKSIFVWFRQFDKLQSPSVRNCLSGNFMGSFSILMWGPFCQFQIDLTKKKSNYSSNFLFLVGDFSHCFFSALHFGVKFLFIQPKKKIQRMNLFSDHQSRQILDYAANHIQYQIVNRMQEIFEPKIDIFAYPQILTLEQQKQKLKCPNNNQAYSVCIGSRCQIPGLMCMELACQCRKAHHKCHHIQLQRVLESIKDNQKQVPEEARKSYRQLQKNINEMIDQLSNLRRKLDLEEKYFGLAEQQLQFMVLIDQQRRDNICGKIISELQKTFQVKNSFTIKKQQQISIDFKQKRQQLDQILKYIDKFYTKCDKKQRAINQLLFDSKIINKKQQKEMIHQWLSENSKNKIIKSKLLFRASQHNFQTDKFHRYCDRIGNVLVIVKNQFDKIVGGFTPIGWMTTNKQGDQFAKDQTGKSFMFSINLRQKYKCTKPQSSILNNVKCGPAFGGGNGPCDLVLKDHCNNNNKSFACFADTYNLQIKGVNKYQKNEQTKTLFAGSPDGQFKVKQYEVYQITECNSEQL